MLQYIEGIRNFICVQSVTRSVDTSGDGKKFKEIELREDRLDYYANKAHYQVLSFNGKPVPSDKKISHKYGYIGNGTEFNGILQGVFDPQVKANFQWDHKESAEGETLCVFRYQVEKENSTLTVTNTHAKVKQPHHGFVSVACDSGEIRRLQVALEPVTVPIVIETLFIKKPGEVISTGTLDIRYRPTVVGPKTFPLPQTSLGIIQWGKSVTKSESKFHDYRKFDSESRILTEPVEEEADRQENPPA